MLLYDIKEYCDDIKFVVNLNLPWDELRGRSIMLSGVTGLIGSFLIDVIFEKNRADNLDCNVFLLGRSEQNTKNRFLPYIHDSHFNFVKYDASKPIQRSDIGNVDYIFHLASNTQPKLYSSDPIGTITTNIIGLNNLLNFAVEHSTRRFVFASSNEIYGENRGDIELFNEDYNGYINCNTLRAGYPESKRCGEALCQAYATEKSLDVLIARFTRTYGPTMKLDDTKAVSQFIRNGLAGENVVLKSDGSQFYSFSYVADAVAGALCILLCGVRGEAYNISDESGDIQLKDLAKYIADICGTSVVYEQPNPVEAEGYSKATKARLDGHKLQKLGWGPRYDIYSGMKRTISILKSINDIEK